MSYQEFMDLREKHAGLRVGLLTAVLAVLWVVGWGWLFHVTALRTPPPEPVLAAPAMTWLEPSEASAIRIWSPTLFALPPPNPAAAPRFDRNDIVPETGTAPDMTGLPLPGPSPRSVPVVAVAAPPPSPPPMDPVLAGERFFRGGVVATWTGPGGRRSTVPVAAEVAAGWVEEEDRSWSVVVRARREDHGWLDDVLLDTQSPRPDLDRTLVEWASGLHVPGAADPGWGRLDIRYQAERRREPVVPAEAGAP